MNSSVMKMSVFSRLKSAEKWNMSYLAEVGLVSVQTSDSNCVRPHSKAPGCIPGLVCVGKRSSSSYIPLNADPCSESTLQRLTVTFKLIIDCVAASAQVPRHTCVRLRDAQASEEVWRLRSSFTEVLIKHSIRLHCKRMNAGLETAL